METIKSLARRTQQSLRERLGQVEATPTEERLAEVSAKVRVMEQKSHSIAQKAVRAARLMEELGSTLKEIGEDYREVPDLAPESERLAAEVYNVGVKLLETSHEHQKGLKDNSFDLLSQFRKECDRMREVDATRRINQLEYDFFKTKVMALRRNPPADFSRIPRNEQIMENWRVELFRVTENNKALCSQLYLEGRRAIDMSVLTTVQVLNSFVQIASESFKATFYSAHLPQYPTAPVLPPSSLPPNPLPPIQCGTVYKGIVCADNCVTHPPPSLSSSCPALSSPQIPYVDVIRPVGYEVTAPTTTAYVPPSQLYQPPAAGMATPNSPVPYQPPPA